MFMMFGTNRQFFWNFPILYMHKAQKHNIVTIDLNAQCLLWHDILTTPLSSRSKGKGMGAGWGGGSNILFF